MAPEGSLNELARLLNKADRGAQIAQELSGNMQPTFGTIVDIEDPERRGRVKVILDQANPEFLTENEYDNTESQPTKTDWIKPDVPFRGVQPENLVGMRVPIKARNGDPSRLSFGSPIYDPEETETGQWSSGGNSRSGGGDEIPSNSDMVRLQVFPTGSLPDASQENHGCIVLEEGGPMECDWLCVCAKRKGEFFWVRLVDLQHGHAGQDDGDQDPDTDGDGEVPVQENSTWDWVFPTTHKEMEKQSIHGVSPRDNPEGGEAKHHGGA